MQTDPPTLGNHSYSISDESHLAPTVAEFMKVVDTGGWIETSMMPLLLVILKKNEISRQTAATPRSADELAAPAITNSAAVWRRIPDAVRGLANTTPPGQVRRPGIKGIRSLWMRYSIFYRTGDYVTGMASNHK